MTVSRANTMGAAGLLWALWVLGGCGHKPAENPPPPPQPSAVAAPQDVVKSYLTELEAKDYRAAYDRLTSDSRSLHSFDAFRKAAQQGGPIYDFERLETKDLGPDRAEVSVGLAEDPAMQSFELKREDKQWRIVFHSGSPGAPRAG